jgi:hypothetical protein
MSMKTMGAGHPNDHRLRTTIRGLQNTIVLKILGPPLLLVLAPPGRKNNAKWYVVLIILILDIAEHI